MSGDSRLPLPRAREGARSRRIAHHRQGTPPPAELCFSQIALAIKAFFLALCYWSSHMFYGVNSFTRAGLKRLPPTSHPGLSLGEGVQPRRESPRKRYSGSLINSHDSNLNFFGNIQHFQSTYVVFFIEFTTLLHKLSEIVDQLKIQHTTCWQQKILHRCLTFTSKIQLRSKFRCQNVLFLIVSGAEVWAVAPVLRGAWRANPTPYTLNLKILNPEPYSLPPKP
jgi:hypothetical protein